MFKVNPSLVFFNLFLVKKCNINSDHIFELNGV